MNQATVSDINCSVDGCGDDGYTVLIHPEDDEKRIYCNRHTGPAIQYWGAEQLSRDDGFPVLVGGPTSYIPKRARDERQEAYSVIDCPECGCEAYKRSDEPLYACRSCEVGSNILFRASNYGPRWGEVRSWILHRDGYSCTKCDSTEGAFHIHHQKKLVYFNRVEEANQPENLVTLCERCHDEIEEIDQAGECDRHRGRD